MSERDIFIAALEQPDPAARAAYLEAACGTDPALRARVETLLRAHERPDSLLDVPVAAPADAGEPTRTSAADAEADGGDLSFLAPPARPDALGRIGHYEALEVLGRGGFGIVFRALDGVLHRVVAVKVLAPQMAATSPARKRFLREARSSAQVRHENVVQVHAVEESPLPFLVMEFIPGETLQQMVNRTGPLDPAEAARVARQVAEGLAAAHEKELIHRDVKPGNILIEAGAQGRVKLTDFGLARAADDASITQSGVVAGTPMYMSPEQARGAALDCRSALFSLGSVLYLMLTGRPPFRADGTLAVLRRVAEDRARPIREVIPEVPERLCKIVEKLHAKDPLGRFQTAREVADELAALLATPQAPADDRGAPDAPPPEARGMRRLAVAAAVAAVALVAAGAAALFLARPGAERESDTPPAATSPPPPVAAPESEPPHEAFARRVAALPPGEQVNAVVDELKRRERARNPSRDFDWKVDSRVEGGRVVMLDLSEVEDVPDVAAVAALRHLRELHLPTRVADIGPLKDLKLRELTSYGGVAFGDLGALRDMPLDFLMLWRWPGTDMTVLRGKKLTFLNLGGGGGKIDLTVLKDMPLRQLYVMETDVEDVTPLAGLPLEQLGLGRTRVKSLESLRNMRLTRFSCNGTAVTDLGPLERMPLDQLYADGAPIKSFAPVAKAPLRQITLDFDAARDAAVLRGIATLEEINRKPAEEFWRSVGLPGGAARPKAADADEVFARTVASLLPRGQVKAVDAELRRRNPDLTGQLFHKAADGRVVSLNLGLLKNLKDVAPVAALRHPRELQLPPTVTDIGPLKGLELRELTCYGGTGFTDLTPLGDMPLEHLLLWQWKGNDLSPLRGRPHQALRKLNVGGGEGKVDLTALKGMQLTDLYVQYTGVDDLSPLTGMKLKVLSVSHTRVADLAPIRDAPLEILGFESTRVTDFGPIAGMPLKDVRLDFVPDKHADLLRGMKTLEMINEKSVAEFWKAAGK